MHVEHNLQCHICILEVVVTFDNHGLRLDRERGSDCCGWLSCQPLLIDVWQKTGNLIGDAMVSVLASNVVDRGFETHSSLTKNYKIGIYCFSAKSAVLISTSKY